MTQNRTHHNPQLPKTMFEAKLQEGLILKKIVEAIKDVVNDVNIDVSPSGKHQNTNDPHLRSSPTFARAKSYQFVSHPKMGPI